MIKYMLTKMAQIYIAIRFSFLFFLMPVPTAYGKPWAKD